MNTAGDNISIRLLEMKDAEALHDLRVRNKHFLIPFEPLRTDLYSTLENQKQLITQAIHDQGMEKLLFWYISRKGTIDWTDWINRYRPRSISECQYRIFIGSTA